MVSCRVDWGEVELVIFDLDGTLYDQRSLRVRMIAALLAGTLRTGNLRLPMILRRFRQVREELGDKPERDFVRRQNEITAQRCACSVDDVRAIVGDWIERRPLAYLSACRLPGVQQLFEALARTGKTVAVLSDYPAAAKLEALGLQPHLVVSSDEADIGWLKPHPAGLHKILNRTQIAVSRAVLIGDRIDRDWEVARRVGMRALIRSRRAHEGVDTFRSYLEEPFAPLLQRLSADR